jgi:hypothetical protein
LSFNRNKNHVAPIIELMLFRKIELRVRKQRMSSVSTELQDMPAASPSPAKAAKPKKEKKKPAQESSTFVGRIADLEVSSTEATAPQCVFHLKGKKTTAKQSFSIPATDPNLNSLLLQTALFSFANQIKVHISAKPGNGNRLTVSAIKLSQKH